MIKNYRIRQSFESASNKQNLTILEKLSNKLINKIKNRQNNKFTKLAHYFSNEEKFQKQLLRECLIDGNLSQLK